MSEGQTEPDMEIVGGAHVGKSQSRALNDDLLEFWLIYFRKETSYKLRDLKIIGIEDSL